MRLNRLFITGLICLLLQSCASTAITQQMQLGKVSFTDGNYKIAFRQLLPVAVYGKREAQYAVGYMYYYGYGVSRDTESGLFWMNKAAEQHYCPAAQALMLIRRGPPLCDVDSDRSVEYRRSYKGENFLPSQNINPPHEHFPAQVSPNMSPPYEYFPAQVSPNVSPPHAHFPAPVSPNMSPPHAHFPAQVSPNVSPPHAHFPAQVSPNISPSHAHFPAQVSLSSIEQPILRSSSSQIRNLHAFVPAVSSPHSYSPGLSQYVADGYGLQLYGAFKLEHVRNLQSDLHLQKVTRIWHTKNQAKDWFVLTYGSYPSIAAAKLARDSLPPRVSDLEPWVRKLSPLEKV